MSTSINLINLFVFNSNLVTKEGDEIEKILYYYPETDAVDDKLNTVGLCEAILKFTENFSPEKPCESVHTQKTRQLYFNFENDYWIILTLGIPSQPKTKDGHTFNEFYGEEVQDHVYIAQLRMIYKMFRLLFGTFEYVLKHCDFNTSVLKNKLNLFIGWYLTKLKLNNLDVLDTFHGINFLPLERLSFLKIQCFLNLLEAKFKEIKYLTFLFNDQLVSSGLKQEDNQILFRYLTMSLLPTFLEQELQSPNNLKTKQTSSNSKYSYMALPKIVTDPNSFDNFPKLYVNCQGRKCEKCYLIIYRVFCATLVIFIGSKTTMSSSFLEELDGFLSPQLQALASDVGDQYSKSTAANEQPSKHYFVYYNHINLAQKQAPMQDLKKTSMALLPVTPDQIKLLCDFNLDLTEWDCSELFGKTNSDSWIVAKSSDQRELYLILQQKNSNILDVHQEMKRINNLYFQNMFILD